MADRRNEAGGRGRVNDSQEVENLTSGPPTERDGKPLLPPPAAAPPPAPRPATASVRRATGGSAPSSDASAMSRLDTNERDRLVESYRGLEGQVLRGRYALVRLIGIGGMGAVFLAEQRTRSFRRQVAVKLIPGHDPELAARFEREAALVADLHHPNTVTLFDFGHTPSGYLYMVMEYLEGLSLRRVLKEERALHPMRAIHVATQVLRALGEAHGKGIVHRDIKPANIMIVPSPEDADFVKVLDFGIAKLAHESLADHEAAELTSRGQLLGTPKYMSPEQLHGRAVSPASDLFNVGLVLYRAITGTHPFPGTNVVEVATAILKAPPPPMVSPLNVPIPDVLETTIRRALHPAPEGRFGHTGDFLAALAACRASYERTGEYPAFPVRPVAARPKEPELPEGSSRISASSRASGLSRSATSGGSPRMVTQRTLWLIVSLMALLATAAVVALLLTLRQRGADPARDAAATLAAAPAEAAQATADAGRPGADATPTQPAEAGAPEAPTAVASTPAPAPVAPSQPANDAGPAAAQGAAPDAGARLAAAAPAEAGPAAAATEKPVRVVLVTRHPGLQAVHAGTGEVLGTTPLTLDVTRRDLPLRVRFRQGERESAEFTVTVDFGRPETVFEPDLKAFLGAGRTSAQRRPATVAPEARRAAPSPTGTAPAGAAPSPPTRPAIGVVDDGPAPPTRPRLSPLEDPPRPRLKPLDDEGGKPPEKPAPRPSLAPID